MAAREQRRPATMADLAALPPHVQGEIIDVAGWRRERLPDLPLDRAMTLAPDWVCEVLSPYNRRHDVRDRRQP